MTTPHCWASCTML